ncbi:MAG: 3-oxoacyl-[acyl-carrier-protein] synthase III C-terminal domain-containing protein [Cyanobacteria bacterium P01_G01_bin.39]
MYQSVGIKSLAVSFPSVKRTNDYYRHKYPEQVAQAEEETLAKVFSTKESSASSQDFDRAMQPYLSDPFRGTVTRYVLGEGESSLSLETHAAKETLKAGKINPEDVDLILVASMFPERLVEGNVSLLLHELSLSCPAWNINSMHSGALAGLQTAWAMVKSGEYQNVLVIVSCTYSRNLGREDDTTSWIVGDGAGAFLVSSLETDQGIIGTNIINTAITNDVYSYSLIEDERNNLQVRLMASKNMSWLIRDHSAEFIRRACDGVIADANLNLNQIDFFVTSTPLAWFAELFINTLNIDRRKTLDMYPYYGNIGAALPIANLYYAAKLGKIKEGDLVLLFSIGGASTAAATVMRWGNVALGNAPDIELPISVSKSRINEQKPDVSPLVTSG